MVGDRVRPTTAGVLLLPFLEPMLPRLLRLSPAFFLNVFNHLRTIRCPTLSVISAHLFRLQVSRALRHRFEEH